MALCVATTWTTRVYVPHNVCHLTCYALPHSLWLFGLKIRIPTILRYFEQKVLKTRVKVTFLQKNANFCAFLCVAKIEYLHEM